MKTIEMYILGSYKYYDMDKIIEEALNKIKFLLEE